MKKIFLVICLVYLYGILNCQLATINDPDGFVNVRKNRSTESEIIDKIYENEFFWIYDDYQITESDKNGWENIGYLKPIERITEEDRVNFKSSINWYGTVFVHGYIHQSRIQYIQDYPSLPIEFQSKYILQFSNDTLKVKIEICDFDSTKHEHKLYPNDWEIQSIDGKKPWGCPWDLPEAEIKSVTIQNKNTLVTLPTEAIESLYAHYINFFRYTKIYLAPDGKIIIYMNPGDGAGAYSVVWLIQNNKYVSRTIGGFL